jgi:hypothetical protein
VSPLVQFFASFMAERRGGFRLGGFPLERRGLHTSGTDVEFGPEIFALAHS